MRGWEGTAGNLKRPSVSVCVVSWRSVSSSVARAMGRLLGLSSTPVQLSISAGSTFSGSRTRFTSSGSSEWCTGTRPMQGASADLQVACVIALGRVPLKLNPNQLSSASSSAPASSSLQAQVSYLLAKLEKHLGT